ncbi:MAG TPA: IS110 family transposase [Bryobacteraceae bacterium]|nr:IS110 family transposase [Bryobacteraceae bacterium]
MKKYIGCDMHKKFSVFVAMDETGRYEPAVKISNDTLELRAYLDTLPKQAPIALEASGGWYWFVDELEAAGLDVRLVNPLEAKKRMPGRKKTDQADAAGLAMLLRNGTLPEVWIPPAQLRDLRGLLRARLSLRRHTTILKNRIHGAIRRYGQYEPGEPSNLFCGKGRVQLSTYVGALPQETRLATRHEWQLVDEVEGHIQELEARIRLGIGQLGWVRLLKTLPGVGEILGATIFLEVGEVARFPTSEHLASYAGLTPVVHASGGRIQLGRTSPVANHYLRWAFVEAANCVVMQRKRYLNSHVIKLYDRLRAAKNHGKAAVAVGRHLAEASWWMLHKKQTYREPAPASIASSNNGSARKSV